MVDVDLFNVKEVIHQHNFALVTIKSFKSFNIITEKQSLKFSHAGPGHTWHNLRSAFTQQCKKDTAYL